MKLNKDSSNGNDELLIDDLDIDDDELDFGNESTVSDNYATDSNKISQQQNLDETADGEQGFADASGDTLGGSDGILTDDSGDTSGVSDVNSEDIGEDDSQESFEATNSIENPEVNNAEAVSSTPEEDTGDPLLLLLIDKVIPGILSYMRDCGLNVSSIFYSPEAARNALLTEFDKCDILVMDTGTGLFSGTTARKQLLDLISQCEGTVSSFIFYTDSAIKSDIMDSLGKSKKNVQWFPYQTTMVTIANMLVHCHTYKNDEYDYAEDDIDKPVDLSFKGKPSTKELGVSNISAGLDNLSIRRNVTETEDGLIAGFKPRFKVRLKL